MNGEIAVPRVESAIAAASAASHQLLRPVKLEDDEIAKSIPWRSDIGRWDAQIVDRFPAIESLRRFADPRAVWRYLYFEFAVRPDQADSAKILKALSRELSCRQAASALSDRGGMPALGIGQFLLGPLGVIDLPRPAWTCAVECVQPTHNSWLLDAVGTSDEGESFFDGSIADLCGEDGWSPEWRAWLLGRDWISADEGQLYLFLAARDSWSPCAYAVSRRFAAAHGPMEQLYFCTWDAEPEIHGLLQACIAECRADFFEGVDYGLAPKALRALVQPEALKQLSISETWQLLHVAKLESVLALARERGLVGPPLPEGSFAESLARALLEARDRVGDRKFLGNFMGHAEGPAFDQVLHLLVRQPQPLDLLKPLLLGSDPRVVCALAQMAAAPIRFHRESPAAWDRTSPQEQHALATAIAEGIGCEFESLPPLRASAKPIMAVEHVESPDVARAILGEARVRVEWLLKTATQHLYQLIRLTERSDERSWGLLGVCLPETLEDCARIREWAASQKPKVELRRLTQTQIVAIHARLRQEVDASSPRHVQLIASAQERLMQRFERDLIAQAGNLGAHHNDATLAEMADAFRRLRAFDDFARTTPDVLPGFVRFVREVRAANKPSEVEVEVVPELGVCSQHQKVRHYLSGDLGRRLRRDRIYAFTDVTRNEISVNPIIVDWTDRVRERR